LRRRTLWELVLEKAMPAMVEKVLPFVVGAFLALAFVVWFLLEGVAYFFH